MMGLYVFRRLFKDAKVLEYAVKKLKADNFIEEQQKEKIRCGYKEKIKRLSERLLRLIEMRANGEIDKDTYISMKNKTEADKEQAQQELLIFDRDRNDNDFKDISEDDIKIFLKNTVSAKSTTIDIALIEKFVTKIQVESETQFSWYVALDINSDMENCNIVELIIPYKDALKFRNLRKEILREYQYKELKVKIYY